MSMPHHSVTNAPVPHANTVAELAHANSLAKANRHPEARAAFVRAVEADQTPLSQFSFASYLLQSQEYPTAIDILNRLFFTATSCEDSEFRSAVANNLAVAYRSIGRFELAASFQQQSIGLAEGDGTPDTDTRLASLCCDLSNRACDAIVAGRYDLAEQLLLRSLRLEVRHGSPAGQADDLANLAIVAGLRGEVVDGIRYLWRAYRLHSRSDQTAASGTDLANLAEFYATLGQYEAAIHCLKRALELFQPSHVGDSQQNAVRRLAEFARITQVLQQDPLVN